MVGDFNLFLERAQRNNFGFVSLGLAISLDQFDLSIQRRKREKTTEHLVIQLNITLADYFTDWSDLQFAWGDQNACFGITWHRLRSDRWFWNFRKWSLWWLSNAVTVAKVMIPGHKKEIVGLIRLLLVSRHCYSWIWRPAVVLLSVPWRVYQL